METFLIVLLVLNLLCIPLDIWGINEKKQRGASTGFAWFTLFLNIAAVLVLGIPMLV